MERLTSRDVNGTAIYELKHDDGTYIKVQEVCDRLAAYEDTGLEPEDITKLRDKLSAAVECICKIEDALNRGVDNDWAREAISEYEEAVKALEAQKGGNHETNTV